MSADSIDRPFTIPIGSFKNSLNPIFDGSDPKRISAELAAVARDTQNLLHVSSMNWDQLGSIGTDNFLVQHGQLSRTLVPENLGGLRIDWQFRNDRRATRHIPTNAPILCLSKPNGVVLKLNESLFFNIIESNAWDSPTIDGDFTEIFYRAHRGALLDFPTAFGEGRVPQAHRRSVKYRLKEFEVVQRVRNSNLDRFGRSHVHLFMSLREKMFANLKSHIVWNSQKILDLYLDDLIRVKVQGSSRKQKQIANRLKVYLQPQFIKDGHGLHQLTVNHPTFRMDSGRWLSINLRRYLCHLIQPVFELLVWALAPATDFVDRRYNKIPPPPLGHYTTQELESRIDKFNTWHFYLKGNERNCLRMLPLMRFCQLYRHSLHDLDPLGKGSLPGPQFAPMKKHFKPEALYSDAYVLMTSILPALTQARHGIPGIDRNKLMITQNSSPTSQRIFPSEANLNTVKGERGKRSYRMRVWFMLLDLQGRCRKFDEATKTYRKYEHNYNIDRIGLSTTGKFQCSVTVKLLMPSKTILKLRPELAQHRFWPVEDLHSAPRNLLVPHPDEVYPGTKHTGSISHLSRAPVLLPLHITNRPVAGGDFGQKEHVVVAFAHQATAHDAMEAKTVAIQNRITQGTLTAEVGERRIAEAKSEFKDTTIRVRNSHTQMQILASRHNQLEKAKRAKNRRECIENGREDESVDMREQDLRAHRHTYKGTSIQAMYQENVRRARHHRPLSVFYKKSNWLENSNDKLKQARQAYFPRMAAFISKKTSRAAFYTEGSPIIKGNRTARKTELRKRRNKTSDHKRKQWLANPPAIATGTDGTGQWAAGQPPARGLGMVKHLGDLGVTVLMVPEAGTSAQDALAHPNMDHNLPLPNPATPQDVVSGVPSILFRAAKSAMHWCSDTDHKVRYLRLHSSNGVSSKTSGKQRYCVNAEDKNQILGFTSFLHPQKLMRSNHRLQLSVHQMQAGHRHTATEFELDKDNAGQDWSDQQRTTNDQQAFAAVVHRDIASADLQRSLLQIASWSGSQRPAYNDRTGHYVAPDDQDLQRWRDRDPMVSRHVRTL